MAERLEAWRAAKGLSRAAVGRLADVGRQAAQNWFEGINPPSVAQAVKLAERGGLSLDILFLDQQPLVAKLAVRIAAMPPEQQQGLDALFGATTPSNDRVAEALGKPGK